MSHYHIQYLRGPGSVWEFDSSPCSFKVNTWTKAFPPPTPHLTHLSVCKWHPVRWIPPRRWRPVFVGKADSCAKWLMSDVCNSLGQSLRQPAAAAPKTRPLSTPTHNADRSTANSEQGLFWVINPMFRMSLVAFLRVTRSCLAAKPRFTGKRQWGFFFFFFTSHKIHLTIIAYL